MFEYVGNLHVHSNRSDGSSSIKTIAREAAAAGLDFVGITDHNTLSGLLDGQEGWYGNLLVLIGEEVNNEKNHYLAFNITEEIPPDTDNPQEVIDAVKQQGGLGFIAHPFEGRSVSSSKEVFFPWEKGKVTGFDGIEIWNYCSQWREKSVQRLRALFWYLFDRSSPVRFPPPEVLRCWDQLASCRRTVAIGGTDAHAITRKVGPLNLVFFPYRELFRTINTHVLLPEKAEDDFGGAKEQIFHALGNGNCFVGLDCLHDTRGFRFTASTGTEEVIMGERITFRPGISLQVVSPVKQSYIRIIKNGLLTHDCRCPKLMVDEVNPGIYRPEVYWCPPGGIPRPWIYANPIYITDEQEAN